MIGSKEFDYFFAAEAGIPPVFGDINLSLPPIPGIEAGSKKNIKDKKRRAQDWNATKFSKGGGKHGNPKYTQKPSQR